VSSGNQPPVAYTSVSELKAIIGPLQQTAQSILTDLGKIHIEKWKTSASNKQETLTNLESVQRNLQSALPEIITQLNNSPEDLSTSFKLYRNLDALYDVMTSVAESAGAFGSKDEFQSLSNDLSAFERCRRELGGRLETLTTSKEAELSQLRTQIKTLQAAPPPPPKKIVIDDNEPKKPAPKKKPVPKPPKPPSASTPSTTPQQAPPTNPQQ
jgi:predicted  nucleic acid-binding Zn-ribbon protein